MMTEQEAQGKWCPMTRLLGIKDSIAEGTSWNREPGANEHPSAACCIGSKCMMWRFEPHLRGDGPVEEKIVPAGEAHTLIGRNGFRWYSGEKTEEGVRWGLFPLVGLCGLAGPALR